MLLRVDLDFEDLLKHVVNKAKLCILDAIGCGLFGSRTPLGKIMLDFVKEPDGKGESIVWGSNVKTSRSNAALANGTFVSSFELDDYLHEGLIHAGAVTIPAAISVAQRKGGIDGRKLIVSIVAGYEVGSRVGVGAGGVNHFHRGWHPTGTHGTFGAAAAAGKILNLDEEKMIHAFGIAGDQASGLAAAQHGAMVKFMHSGKAAQSGVVGALLAQMGFTGITNILEAEFGGYCKTLSDIYNLGDITHDLGEKLALSNVSLKPYPCCAYNFSAFEALNKIVTRHDIKPQNVERIVVRATETLKTHIGWEYVPGSIASAQMNLPYGISVMLLEGEVSPDQYTEEKIKDPRIIDFTRRLEIVVDPELPSESLAATVEVQLKSGKRFSHKVSYPKGDPMNPMTKEEVYEKFKKLASKALKKNKIEEIIQIVENLDEIEDILILSELLRA